MLKRVLNNVAILTMAVLLMFSFVACSLPVEEIPRMNEKIEGVLISLEEAFEERYLVQTDLKHIVYFMCGKVHELNKNNEWKEIKFKPTITKPEISDLEQEMIDGIKNAYYVYHQEDIDRGIANSKLRGFIDENVDAFEYAMEHIWLFRFFGEYNGVYAVQVSSNFISYVQMPIQVSLNGIVWLQQQPILIYK